jgi:primosomal protein N' (replication factor Y)
LAEELELREGLGYPPYVRLANVLVWGRNEDAVRTAAKGLYHDLSQLVAGKGAGWLVLPPTPCVFERLKGSWRYHVVVKAPLKGNIAECFASYFRERKPHHDVRVSIDIDPVNLL